MTGTYTAVVQQDGDWWIGWIEEVPGVNCQEPTREELIETLRVTLREALELNREDALAAAGHRYTVLCAIAVAHEYLPRTEVHVLYPKQWSFKPSIQNLKDCQWVTKEPDW